MTRGDWLVIALLFGASLLLFTLAGNVEFQGDDDFSVAASAAGVANSFRWPEGLPWPKALASMAINLDLNLIALRHGAFPVFYDGLALRLFEIWGMPFSRATIQLPFALVASLCCAMFYAILRRTGSCRQVAVIATVFMAVTPLYASGARGIATEYMITPFFHTFLCLLALTGRVDSRFGRIFLSFALFNTILGESLFFLVLPALLVAYVGASPKGEIKARLAPFARPVVLVPNIAALAAVLQSTVDYNHLAFDSFDSIRMGSLFRGHARLGDTVLDSLGRFHEYVVLLGGELFPLLFVVLLVAALLGRVKLRRDVVTLYGIVAGIGFFVLFYGILTAYYGVKVNYQIYILTPLVMLFARLLDGLEGRRVKTIGGLAVATALMAQLALVWQNSSFVFSPWIFAENVQGGNNPDRGRRPLGYLMREVLAGQAAAKLTHPVGLTVERRLDEGERGTVTTLLMYGGAEPNLVRGFHYGFDIAIKRPAPDAAGSQPPALCPGYYCAFLDLRADRAEPADPQAAARFQLEREDGSVLGTLLVAGAEAALAHASVAPGSFKPGPLEQAFDAKYRRFGDFLPAGTYNNTY